MIATEIRNSVQVLKKQSRSLHEISRLLKLPRNTVRRILREPDAAASPPCKPQTLARLEDAFARCGSNVVRVRQLLAKEDLDRTACTRDAARLDEGAPQVRPGRASP